MNKILTIFSVVCLFTLGFVGISQAGMMTREEAVPCNLNDLIGTQVKTPTGEVLGSISEFVYDPHGRAALAIIYRGAYEDFDFTRYVAVPFGDLSISGKEPSEMSVVLNVDEEVLNSAPSFERTGNINDRDKWADVYRYFGLQPYWTEE